MVSASTVASLCYVTILMVTVVQSAAIKENHEKATSAENKPTAKEFPALERATRSLDLPQKRPFCNAFTGCGRKRSGMNTVAEMPREMFNSLEPNNIFDFNSEPAVADIMQQIMSEAKVWDAIQAANRELRKPSGMNGNNYPTFSAQ